MVQERRTQTSFCSSAVDLRDKDLKQLRHRSCKAILPSDALVQELSREDRPITTIGEVTRTLHNCAFGMVLLLSALPGLVPAPPGYGLFAGLLPLLLGFQMLAGQSDPLLPKAVAHRRIARKELDRMLNRALPWIRQVECLGRPRIAWHIGGRTARIVVSTIIIILALAIAVPLPLSNALPAAGIAMIGISLFQRDGLLAAAGVAVGVAGLALTTAVSVGIAGFAASALW